MWSSAQWVKEVPDRLYCISSLLFLFCFMTWEQGTLQPGSRINHAELSRGRTVWKRQSMLPDSGSSIPENPVNHQSSRIIGKLFAYEQQRQVIRKCPVEITETEPTR